MKKVSLTVKKRLFKLNWRKAAGMFPLLWPHAGDSHVATDTRGGPGAASLSVVAVLITDAAI